MDINYVNALQTYMQRPIPSFQALPGISFLVLGQPSEIPACAGMTERARE